MAEEDPKQIPVLQGNKKSALRRCFEVYLWGGGFLLGSVFLGTIVYALDIRPQVEVLHQPPFYVLIQMALKVAVASVLGGMATLKLVLLLYRKDDFWVNRAVAGFLATVGFIALVAMMG